MQIISLGAGTDTRAFRLFEDDNFAKRLLYHEVDFPECTRKKITAITNAKLLADTPEIVDDGTRLTSTSYTLHPLDLRKLAATSSAIAEEKDAKSLLSYIDPFRPTLLLSECCFTYLESATAASILRHFLKDIISPSVPVFAILYEPLHPNDAFGKTMTSNLYARSIALPGLEACPDIRAHTERLKDCHFEKAGGMLVKDWWKNRVSDDEKERLRHLEGLDEEEEWELLAGHYGFIWGSRGNINWPQL